MTLAHEKTEVVPVHNLSDTFGLLVTSRKRVADGIVAIELQDPGGSDLPPWEPGAHIDLIFGEAGILRQYSLCANPLDRSRWMIAVLREDMGRGGSLAIHDHLVEGSAVQVRPPRNNFALVPGNSFAFIAGGIGITPFLPMIAQLERAGADWQLHYAGRSPSSMAFADQLVSDYGEKVRLYPKSQQQILGVDSVVASLPDATEVFACGPIRLLNEIGDVCAARHITPHVECFSAAQAGAQPTGEETAFEVELARTGTTIVVEPGQSILEAAEAAGADVFGSCLEGVCGTCETRVLGGMPDHRDFVLEGSPKDSMMICVSRAACPRLILDI